jgi:hypothetical protein
MPASTGEKQNDGIKSHAEVGKTINKNRKAATSGNSLDGGAVIHGAYYNGYVS